jgi:hypothetical protein
MTQSLFADIIRRLGVISSAGIHDIIIFNSRKSIYCTKKPHIPKRPGNPNAKAIDFL